GQCLADAASRCDGTNWADRRGETGGARLCSGGGSAGIVGCLPGCVGALSPFALLLAADGLPVFAALSSETARKGEDLTTSMSCRCDGSFCGACSAALPRAAICRFVRLRRPRSCLPHSKDAGSARGNPSVPT